MSDERLQTAFLRLHEIMGRLRRECPWDRKQTAESLRRYLIEETHEVLEALDAGDRTALRSELGDLLFQVWFHAQVAGEGGPDAFDLADVLEGIAAKLVRRHPHVFGDATAANPEAVRKKWDELKLLEGRTSRLDGMPKLLPAALAAQVLQDKAAAGGFTWKDVHGEIAKVREELVEFVDEIENAASEAPDPRLVAEYGDLLFALVNLGRRLGMSAEDALRGANAKFARRFRHVESAVVASGRRMEDHSLVELMSYWEDAKAKGL